MVCFIYHNTTMNCIIMTNNSPAKPPKTNDSLKLQAISARQHSELQELRAQLNLRDDYISHLSHQLRTPLMAIMGYSALLENANEPKETQTQLLHAAQSMLAIIQDLPDSSRQPRQLQLRPANPAALAGELQGFFSYEAQRKHLQYAADCDAAMPESVVCDTARIRQVMLILVQNAIKFTQQGSVNVHISLQQMHDTHATVIYCVEDTGVGIAPQRMDNLFLPPIQSKTSRSFGRAGHSLSLAYSLVESMGGVLTAENRPEYGAQFSFALTLPVYFAASEPTAPPQTRHNAAAHDWSNQRILVVDDNEMNRRLLQRMVKMQGVGTVDCAADGEEACAMIFRNDYALVLMDCQMPKMDGFTATRHIRQSVRSSLPIIGVTADVVRSNTAKCFAAGMDDYCQKPLSAMDLHHLLHRWLGRA